MLSIKEWFLPEKNHVPREKYSSTLFLYWEHSFLKNRIIWFLYQYFSILEQNGEKRKVYIKYRDRLPLVPLKMVFNKNSSIQN